MRRRGQRGLTLIELIAAFTVMLILTTMAVPLTKSKIRVERERELRYALKELTTAIDKYKDNCDAGFFGPTKIGSNCYPENLEILVKGQKIGNDANGKVMKFLRRIPVDPFTGTAEWGLRSDQDDPTSQSFGGQNVFDVYSKTTQKDGSGRAYSDY